MRILVEILHPAHVHVFKNAIGTWTGRGDKVLVLSREKDCTNELLEAAGVPFKSISRIGSMKWMLVPEMLVRVARMLYASLKFKPDVLVGVMGVTIVQVGRILRKPAVVFYDTENATLTNRFVYPLAHSVCTPSCYRAPVNGRHVTYPGYHELAYLHPDRFRPDAGVLGKLGLEQGQPFSLVRFVSWQASHDIGEKGLGIDFKRALVARLSRSGKVFITSEDRLPADLDHYRFPLPPHHLHDALAQAMMVVGESATMASEAAVLGVPALYISDTGRGYTDEEESYGLIAHFTTRQPEQIMRWLDDHLSMPDLADAFSRKRKKLLAAKVDTTTWMIRYIDSVVRA